MNDNLDYLRLLSNKNHARIVWLENPNSYREKSIGGLLKVLDLKASSPVGFCLIAGSFVGERTVGSVRDTSFRQ